MVTTGFIWLIATLFGTTDDLLTQYKVVYCNGTTHYLHGISVEAYKN